MYTQFLQCELIINFRVKCETYISQDVLAMPFILIVTMCEYVNSGVKCVMKS